MSGDQSIKSDLFGGEGGAAFDDHPAPGRVTRIVVHHGDYIDGLAVFYGDHEERHGFGTGGGTQTVIDLDANTPLLGVSGYADRLVNQLTFFVKRTRWVAFESTDAAGRTGGYEDYLDAIGPFGQPVGEPFESKKYNEISAFFGRSGDALDAIGVWQSTYETGFAIPAFATAPVSPGGPPPPPAKPVLGGDGS